MTTSSPVKVNTQSTLFKDFVKQAPKQNTALILNNNSSDTFKKKKTDKPKSKIKKVYDYLMTPIDNPKYKKGIYGAAPKTTRLKKYGSFALTAAIYGFLFFYMAKMLKIAEVNIAGANSKAQNPAAFMEKYKEDLTNAPILKDLALPDVLKGTVDRLMNKIKDPQTFIQKGGTNKNTILLYGPPGTGKTTVARAIAREIENAELFSVDLSTVQGKFVGESEGNLDKIIRNVCKYAKENPLKKVVVLMDEFDSVAIKDNGSTNQQYHASLLNVLKRGISEKLVQHDNVILIATTNAELNKPKGTMEFVQKLDSAIADRFGEQIRVDNPTKGQFIKAIVHHYKNLSKVDEALKTETSEQVSQIAQKLSDNNCTFRNLENLFNNSAAVSKDEKLTLSDVLSALDTIIKSNKK